MPKKLHNNFRGTGGGGGVGDGDGGLHKMWRGSLRYPHAMDDDDDDQLGNAWEADCDL